MEKKRRTILAVILVATIVVSVLGTYAFFTTQGRIENQKLTVQTGSLALTFEDNDDGVSKQMNLGDSVTKEFIIRNTGTQAVTTNMLWSNLKNTYLEESLSYKLEYKTTSTGTYSLVETASATIPHTEAAQDKALAKDLTIPSGAVYYYKLTITFEDLDINQDSDKMAMLATKFKLGDVPLTASEKTLAALSLKAKSDNPNFVNIATTDETKDGLYAMEDDYGTSYYFRGAVENNYVKFAGFWWRIIRINGDGSIRMLYDGTVANAPTGYANGENDTKRVILTDIAWNTNSNDAKYVGYMFGGANGTASNKRIGLKELGYEDSENAIYNETNSNIKTALERWFEDNLSSYDKYLGDEIFCNDRSFGSDNIGTGYGNSSTSYVSNRVGYPLPTPKFTCEDKNDAFTKSDTVKGNGKLGQKIGLITADEVTAAGGLYYITKNTSYYLYKGPSYWSLTPVNYNKVSYVFLVSDFPLFNSDVTENSGLAPVINLSAEYAATLTGTGIATDPYQIPGVD